MTHHAYRIAAGALGGFVATFPMTALMVLWHRRLPWTIRDPLPPAKITTAALQSFGLHKHVDPQTHAVLSLVNHFGYGTALGAVYGFLDDETESWPAARGTAFALGVWAGSYLGWLPATGMHRSALREPAQRNLLMLAAHVVWGASLGLASAAMKGNSSRI